MKHIYTISLQDLPYIPVLRWSSSHPYVEVGSYLLWSSSYGQAVQATTQARIAERLNACSDSVPTTTDIETFVQQISLMACHLNGLKQGPSTLVYIRQENFFRYGTNRVCTIALKGDDKNTVIPDKTFIKLICLVSPNACSCDFSDPSHLFLLCIWLVTLVQSYQVVSLSYASTHSYKPWSKWCQRCQRRWRANWRSGAIAHQSDKAGN